MERATNLYSLRVGNMLKFYTGEASSPYEIVELDADDLHKIKNNRDYFNAFYRGIILRDSFFNLDLFQLIDGVYFFKYNNHELSFTPNFGGYSFLYKNINSPMVRYFGRITVLHELENIIFGLTGFKLKVDYCNDFLE